MSSAFWIFLVLTSGTIIAIATIGLTRMGLRAYTTGAAHGAPEAFTGFVSHILRISTVLAIISTILILSLRKISLDQSVTAILSGIAGYVLGGADRSRTSLKTSKPTTPTGK